ncbi:MAG: CBS domain-containing protein [Xanthomonadaceae bacterium]|nr:CBS domain-containing protein [Xanthomonadaceae bacterium]
MSRSQEKQIVEDMMVADVVTISPMAKLREAMEAMRDHKIKSLVVDRRSESDAWGILTYTMLLRTIVHEEGDIDLINVYDIAAKPALSVPRQLDVRQAVSLMLKIGVKRLIVTNNNELEGILTMNDIIGTIIDKLDD